MTEKNAPSWIKTKQVDLEKTILDLSKKNTPLEKIGLILRDKHGIPKVKLILGKRISEILKDIDLKDLEKSRVNKRIENIKNHLKNNKHDYPSSRALTKQLWILRKLTRLK